MQKKTIFIFLLFLVTSSLFISCARKTGNNAGQTTVDIFYLPHPPAEAIVKKVDAILQKFPSIKVNKYNFSDPKNARRIEAHNLREHTPVAIFINDKNRFTIEGRTVEFKNFPRGDAFVPTLEGSWTYGDFEKVLTSR